MQNVNIVQGNPCKYGHGGARYKNGACVQCALNRMKYPTDDERARRRVYGQVYHQNKTDEQKHAAKKYHAEWSRSEKGKTSRIGYYFKRKYGITADEFNAMVAAQENACAICQKNGATERHRRLSVDHDHQTNKVRELLCDDCNVGLGHFLDDPKLIEVAAAYLRRHGRA